MLLLLPAAACAPQARPAPNAGIMPVARPGTVAPFGAPGTPGVPLGARVPVALLLPLSGNAKPLGDAMLNAAQLALFAQRNPAVEFLPRDTGGTPTGAADAARGAIAEGARAIAGPLTLTETAAVAAPARAAGIPVLAFTSDSSQAGPGVWVLGVTPAEQVDRVVGVALGNGARRFGLLAPNDALGQRLAEALRARLAVLAAPAPLVVLHPIRGDVAAAARELAAQAGPDGLDAVLLGETGDRARTAAATVATALPRPPQLLGTTLWLADPSLGAEPALTGALFAGPDPFARGQFDASYQASFGERPPSLAGVAYDAASLAARIARDPAGLPPLGEAFLGADGPLRLLPEGGVRRGLALYALDPSGTPQAVQPAPVPGLVGS